MMDIPNTWEESSPPPDKLWENTDENHTEIMIEIMVPVHVRIFLSDEYGDAGVDSVHVLDDLVGDKLPQDKIFSSDGKTQLIPTEDALELLDKVWNHTEWPTWKWGY